MTGHIYCVFEAVFDGDGYLHWEHLFVAVTVKGARDLIGARKEKGFKGLNPSFNESNAYTVVGTRQEASDSFDSESHNFLDGVKGYVIEKQPVY